MPENDFGDVIECNIYLESILLRNGIGNQSSQCSNAENKNNSEYLSLFATLGFMDRTNHQAG